MSYMIYLSTAIWLTTGGSGIVHIYKQTISRTRQIQTIHRTTQIQTIYRTKQITNNLEYKMSKEYHLL